MGRKESNQTNKQNQIQYYNVSHAIKKFYMGLRLGSFTNKEKSR